MEEAEPSGPTTAGPGEWCRVAEKRYTPANGAARYSPEHERLVIALFRTELYYVSIVSLNYSIEIIGLHDIQSSGSRTPPDQPSESEPSWEVHVY